MGSSSYFSNSDREWNDYESVNPDFRIIGNHSIDLHILSSLWIEKVGLSLESKIGENSYGCRLKRINQSLGRFIPTDITEGSFQTSTSLLGHFRPYLYDYKRWQYNGIETIKKALADDKKVLAVTADLKKYYHRIDCSFITDPKFLEFISHEEYTGEQKLLNDLLLSAIESWSRNVYKDKSVPKDFKYKGHAGIPMGLGASKVIANLLLTYLDSELENEIKPLYYGRYVDDLFIVIQDGSTIDTSEKFWEFLKKRIGNLNETYKGDGFPKDQQEYFPTGHVLNVPFSEKSLLEFGEGKEKYFFLEGVSGNAFLDTLKESMEENSSEWKLPPNADEDIASFSEEMAKASSNHEETANGLRKSDGVSIQRLKFILYLTRFEKSVNLLPKTEWSKPLAKFFDLTIEFAIRPENIAIYSKYYARVMALAVRADSFEVAKNTIIRIKSSYENLIHLSSKDETELITNCLKSAQKYQIDLIEEGIFSSINPFENSYEKSSEYIELLAELNESIERINERGLKLFNSDLHKIPFKEIFINHLEDESLYSKIRNVDKNFLLELEGQSEFAEFSKFMFKNVIHRHKSNSEFLPFGFYFYTRPFTLLELSIICPSWHKNLNELKSFCKLFNCEWFEPGISTLSEEPGAKLHKVVTVNSPEKCSDRVVALTSLETKNASWNANVKKVRDPDTSREQRIFDLVKDIMRCNPRCVSNGIKPISYVLFPELAIPHKMLIFIANTFLKARISLIAGMEYDHYSTNQLLLPKNVTGFVSNQLLYVLCTKSRRSTQQVALIQEKVVPAQQEEAQLFFTAGKVMQALDETKFILNHGDFWFSGLICNDLLDINNRSVLRGKIDALIILEWNKDVDYYDYLVGASANDLHTFVLQVNNRLYGDTRLRGPYKEPYDRDKVRVRGGELDYFVIATLEVEKLREFQRNHRSPEKPFKPVPTGFFMSDDRRKTLKAKIKP